MGSFSFTVTLLAVACGAASKPAVVADDCGDMVDPGVDGCPLLEGCPSKQTQSTDTGNDGCPGHGGVPAATACDSDARRFTEVAASLQQMPKLTTLRITSSVPGCAHAIRDGLVRAGFANDRLETFTPPDHDHCDRWGYFSIVAWDGARCAPDPSGGRHPR